MQTRIEEVYPTAEHAAFLAAHLKPIDVEEINQYGIGMKAETLLPEWVDLPGTSVFLLDGVPVAMAGVFDGRIWMFTTEEIFRAPIEAQRISKRKVKQWRADYGPLTNYVWVGNSGTIAWLVALGATFDTKFIRFSEHGGSFVQFWFK